MRALVPGAPWLSPNTQASTSLTTTLRAAQLGTAFVGRMCKYSFSPVTPNTRRTGGRGEKMIRPYAFLARPNVIAAHGSVHGWSVRATMCSRYTLRLSARSFNT
jgi:hypothetical protein